MEPERPADFYTGMVADLYAVLRSADPDPAPYARFIERSGSPALELGCGDGDPLLDLRRRGLDVEGLDSSADMLERCRRRAADLGVDVVLHESPIESMNLGRTYPTIFLAGPTFVLITDDDTALRALQRIARHLSPGGAAMIPLFVPPVVPAKAIGSGPSHTESDGTVLRCITVSVARDEPARRQTVRLRYERTPPGGPTEALERDWVVHWHTQAGFADLAAAAGLAVTRVIGVDGKPATADADQFVFMLAHP